MTDTKKQKKAVSAKDRNRHLQDLIIQQGFILESEAFQLLSRHFGLSFHPHSKISRQLVGRSNVTQEVDVFAAVHRPSQVISNSFFNSIPESHEPLSLSNVLNVFLIECKGHSSDGVLLGRLHHQPSGEKILLKNHLSYYEITGPPTPVQTGSHIFMKAPGGFRRGISRHETHPIVDSCAFYNFDPKRGFTETKDKLFKAMEQISSAGRLFDEELVKWHRSDPPPFQAYTATTMICTNVAITVMEFKKGNVLLNEYDWVFAVNPLFGNETALPNSPDYRLIPVVSVAALPRFCDAVLSDSSDLSLGSSDGRPVHTFDIAEARRLFREVDE